MVLHPALHDLLRAQTGGVVSQEAIGWYGGIIFSIFLIGWAVGGVLFGVLADRFGRTKTLSSPFSSTRCSPAWRPVGHLVATGPLPVPDRPGHRRRMGGGRGAGGRGLARAETGQGGGHSPVGLGRRASSSPRWSICLCANRAGARSLWLAIAAGGGCAVCAALGQRARAVGEGPRAGTTAGRRTRRESWRSFSSQDCSARPWSVPASRSLLSSACGARPTGRRPSCARSRNCKARTPPRSRPM